MGEGDEQTETSSLQACIAMGCISSEISPAWGSGALHVVIFAVRARWQEA